MNKTDLAKAVTDGVKDGEGLMEGRDASSPKKCTVKV